MLKLPTDLSVTDRRQWLSEGVFIVTTNGARRLCVAYEEVDSGVYRCTLYPTDRVHVNAADIDLAWPVLGWINTSEGAVHVSRWRSATFRTYARAVRPGDLTAVSMMGGALDKMLMSNRLLKELFFPYYPSYHEVAARVESGVAISPTCAVLSARAFIGTVAVGTVSDDGGVVVVTPDAGSRYSLKPFIRALNSLRRE